MSIQSESGVHTSQIGVPSASAAGDGLQDGGQGPQKAKKTKLQLWNDLKISGEYIKHKQPFKADCSHLYSNYSRFHINIHLSTP